MKNLILIDSNAIIHRAYHALPKTMSTSKGELTNVVYGFATTLIKVLEDLKPDYIAASFDISKATFRLAEYAQYKAKRVKADQELYDQIPRVKELLGVLKIPIFELEGFEADDCIGTIVECCTKGKDLNVYIVSGDKDVFQLIDGNIFVYNLKHGLSEMQLVDRQYIEKIWHLQPEDFIDLKALAGDPSDNIPGVPGIGLKTAISLLQKFNTLEKIYQEIEKNKDLPGIKPRIIQLIIDNKDQAFLSQRLATIRRDVPIDFNLEDCKWGEYSKDELKDFFDKMQFRSLLRRFEGGGEAPKTKEAKEQAKKDEQLKLL